MDNLIIESVLELSSTYNVAIIGAGIVGASIARVLSQYENLNISLIEKEADVGWGVSKANTALIHGGYDDDPQKYPLRAKFCAKGNELWRKWVEELDIPNKWEGALIIATEERDIHELKDLLRRGKINGVPGMRLIYEKSELERLEPNITDDVIAALYVPTVGQMAPYEAVIALVENAVANGVKLHLLTKVIGVIQENGTIKGVKTNKGNIKTDIVINATGLYADEISAMVGVSNFKITPRRGEYYIFRREAGPKVKKVLFPAPKPHTKGVVVNTTVEDRLLIGPNAQDLPIDMKEATETTFEGLNFVWENAKKLVKKLPPKNLIIRTFSGLRPEPTGGDFIIAKYDNINYFINVAGMRSPGLTAAPSVAYYVVELLKQYGIPLKKKKKWNPIRKGIKKFYTASFQEREQLIKANPLYGKIVCKCDLVTEAEIIEAIRRGATTIDGIKFRTGAFMGECQGNFCLVKIARILARELNIPIWKVTFKGPGTEIGVGDATQYILKKEGHEK